MRLRACSRRAGAHPDGRLPLPGRGGPGGPLAGSGGTDVRSAEPQRDVRAGNPPGMYCH